MSSTRFDEDIWLLNRISLGANFELFLAFWPEENDKVLIKKIRDDIDPERRAEAEERLLKEAATLEEFWSPYFPKVYDIRTKEDGTLYLIVQYFAGVSLRDYINLHMEKKTVSFYFIQNFIQEMDHALNYLHNKKGIVHLDISPDNLIVTSDNKIKIIDFEDSRKAGTALDTSKLRGKEQYLSPQLLTLVHDQSQGIFEPRWDHFAYAKTLEELCEQTHGFDKLKTFKLKKKIKALKKDKSRKLPALSLPKLRLPSLKLKYIATALGSCAILALTLLGLETLGKSKINHTAQRSNLLPNHRVIEQQVSRKSPPKRAKHVIARIKKPVKKYHKKKKATPKKIVTQRHSPRTSPPAHPKVIESEALQINQENLLKEDFRNKFKKLISKKDPYLKECMSYESSRNNSKLSVSFHLRPIAGRAQRISFAQESSLNQLTKSCLMALYADIVFPQHPSQKEIEIVQHFTFSRDSSSNEDAFLL